MLNNFIDNNSNISEITVEDWNILIKEYFSDFFEDENLLFKHKELLRTEFVNYISLLYNPSYLKLFECSYQIFDNLGSKYENELENVLYKYFERIAGADDFWIRSCLYQPNLKELQEHDVIGVKFKAIDDILEGCFKPRFKLLHHANCILNKKSFEEKSFGNYISDFIKTNDIFELYLTDPICKIKTSQWRNIAAHKSYIIKKNKIDISYGKNNVHKFSLSYSEFDSIFDWIKLMYNSLRLAEVITVLGKRNIIRVLKEKAQKINIRIETRVLHIVHNMQIVGFPFVGIVEDEKILSLVFNKKIEGDINESVIHSSQCLDQMVVAIKWDEFYSDKYEYAEVKIVSSDNKELGKSWVKVSDLLVDNKRNNLTDVVKFRIGEIKF